MNKIPVVFSIDHNYVMQAGVCILSLLESSGNDEYYDLFILGANDITDTDKELLKKNISIFQADIHFIEIDNRFDDTFEIRNISKAAYFRLLIPDLIPQYDKIIYSDVDVIFQSGLQKVMNIDLKDNYFGGIKAIGPKILKDYNEYISRLGLDADSYINSGFLLINAKLQREDQLFQKFQKLLTKKFQFQDQDIINVVCKNRITFLPLKYCFTQKSYELYHTAPKCLYNIFPQQEVEESFAEGIIHYEGPDKPWNSFCYRYEYWWNHYKNSVFYDKNYHFQTAYKILHPKWTLKEILRLLRNLIRGDYR